MFTYLFSATSGAHPPPQIIASSLLYSTLCDDDDDDNDDEGEEEVDRKLASISCFRMAELKIEATPVMTRFSSTLSLDFHSTIFRDSSTD